MHFIDAEQLEKTLAFPSLIDRLRTIFSADATAPARPHFSLPTIGLEATLLLMPAWEKGGMLGVKVATVFPDNALHDLPSVCATYLLMDGRTGVPLACLEGRTLTRLRTAAASALAADFLAPTTCSHLLMVGAGTLAPALIQAHAGIRPLRRITIWNRTRERAVQLAERLSFPDIDIAVSDDLEAATRAADLISCATLSKQPLIKGAWLQPGTHLDLVGGYTPEMRETDDEAIRRASLFVDSREGAMKEAGDLLQPLEKGLIEAADIRADLFDLCRGHHPGRTENDEITLFKSVGHALEDLAAARLAYESIC